MGSKREETKLNTFCCVIEFLSSRLTPRLTTKVSSIWSYFRPRTWEDLSPQVTIFLLSFCGALWGGLNSCCYIWIKKWRCIVFAKSSVIWNRQRLRFVLRISGYSVLDSIAIAEGDGGLIRIITVCGTPYICGFYLQLSRIPFTFADFNYILPGFLTFAESKTAICDKTNVPTKLTLQVFVRGSHGSSAYFLKYVC